MSKNYRVKSFLIGITLLMPAMIYAQNEQAPIIEKKINYKNWTYKSIQSGDAVNLREYMSGKKLVVVVYFAPWCHDWAFDAPILERFYEKYKAEGLGIIAVGEYDPLSSMQNNLAFLKITFPAVYESEERESKEKTLHHKYRKSADDERGWGSPWYILLTASTIEKEGELITKKTWVINGEMGEVEGETFIRKHLGLPAAQAKIAVGGKRKIEVCDPDKPSLTLIKPE